MLLPWYLINNVRVYPLATAKIKYNLICSSSDVKCDITFYSFSCPRPNVIIESVLWGFVFSVTR